MTHATLRILREEHTALAAMLRTIPLLLAHHRREGTLPDFEVLRAMLFYIDEFPEKRHHRQESELLFPKLRARPPLSRDLLDHLDADHRRAAPPSRKRCSATSTSTWPTWRWRSARCCPWPSAC